MVVPSWQSTLSKCLLSWLRVILPSRLSGSKGENVTSDPDLTFQVLFLPSLPSICKCCIFNKEQRTFRLFILLPHQNLKIRLRRVQICSCKVEEKYCTREKTYEGTHVTEWLWRYINICKNTHTHKERMCGSKGQTSAAQQLEWALLFLSHSQKHGGLGFTTLLVW